MANNSGNVLVALLTGAVIGVGIGILYAPDKGSNTRDKLKEGIDDAKFDLKDKINSISENLKSGIFNPKGIDGNYESIVSSLSNKTDDVISFLEKKLGDLKQKNANYQK